MRSNPVSKNNENDIDTTIDDSIELTETTEANNNRSLIRHRTEVIQYTGPLPPAREMAAYGKVMSDAPERIMQMAEAQAAHRQTSEMKIIDAAIRSERRGQLFGFSIIFITITCGFYLAVVDKNPEGFGIIIGAVAGLAGLTWFNRARDKHDKKE